MPSAIFIVYFVSIRLYDAKEYSTFFFDTAAFLSGIWLWPWSRRIGNEKRELKLKNLVLVEGSKQKKRKKKRKKPTVWVWHLKALATQEGNARPASQKEKAHATIYWSFWYKSITTYLRHCNSCQSCAFGSFYYSSNCSKYTQELWIHACSRSPTY